MKSIHFSFGKIITISILTFLLIASCDVTDPKKDKPKPEGYQEDIPWPSLADSPWPMSLNNPQATGRTKYIGPSQGIVEWVLDSLNGYANAPVVGSDGTIYTCVYTYPGSYNLIAISHDRNIKWRFDISFPAEVVIAPILSSDNTLYVGGGHGRIDTIYAVTTEGKLKWKKKLTTSEHHISQSSFIVDKIGNIYFADVFQNLYCFDKNGNELWVTNLNNKIFPSTQFSFSPDGKTLYSPGKSSTVIAISTETGEIIKEFGTNKSYITPIIDNTGNIYTTIYNSSEKKNEFMCFNSEGNIKWSYAFWGNSDVDWNQPCIDRYGNFYFGADTLYSISYNGKLNWKLPIDNGSIHSPIICDGNNDLYMGIDFSGSIGDAGFISVSKTGKFRWILNFVDKNGISLGGCPAIGIDNRLYCPTWVVGNKLFSIK